MSNPSRIALLSLVLASAGALGSCVDPVHDAQVKALGAEANGVPQGEFHRAGQPCTTCHEDTGPASTVFSVAGTVFYGPERTIGAGGVEVLMVDSDGAKRSVTTNCVGNFFIPRDAWDPAFPILVSLAQGSTTVSMKSEISREGSCANCHRDPPNFDTPGHVRLLATDKNVTIPAGCPVSPQLLAPGEQPAAVGGTGAK
jgi:cytochrome c553